MSIQALGRRVAQAQRAEAVPIGRHQRRTAIEAVKAAAHPEADAIAAGNDGDAFCLASRWGDAVW